MNSISWKAFFIMVCLTGTLMFLWPNVLTATAAQEATPPKKTDVKQAATKKSNTQETSVQQGILLSDLDQTIEDSFKAESANIQRYREQLAQDQKEKLSLAAAVNGYQLHLSTYGNLLLASGIDIAVLQKAWTELRASIPEIQKMMDDIKPRLSTLASEKTNLAQQQILIDKQISETRRFDAKDTITRKIMKNAEQLFRILKEKENLLNQLQASAANRLTISQQLFESFLSLSAQYETALDLKKKKDLFERQKGFFNADAIRLLVDEPGRILEWVNRLARPGYWIHLGTALWKSAGLVLVSLVIVFGVALFLLGRLRNVVTQGLSHPMIETLGPWHRMMLQLVHGSLRLAGITLLIHLYSRIDVLYLVEPILQLIRNLLLVTLATRWLKLSVGLWPKETPWPEEKTHQTLKLIAFIRYFFWISLVIGFVLKNATGALISTRIIFDLWLLFWAFTAWRDVTHQNFQKNEKGPARQKMVAWLFIKYICYGIGGTSLLLDMVGYGSLSAHWLTSWARSSTVLLWWYLFFFLLQEWDRYYQAKSSAERNELLHDEYPLQWLTIRFGQLVWILSLVILLLMAWGGQQAIVFKTYEMLGHPLIIGNMSFSFLGVLYAALVLLLTHGLARLWRWIFQSKFLNRSGMEIGLQESITTITLYVIWMFGILIALHVFGLNTASLTVAFGALGIGLGFGLQNIFNNFVSGIILLFERPIQIGDDIEINGTWASVKKINFRSTLVQTYDNASLIIPNSDLISSPVTNWSFKDKRIRRSVDVGVAYGSNVTLVRDTLLEIAHHTPKVLKVPKPDVLFKDFGDSALIFSLRIWTDIDNMLKVETAIRFEIDRLFREQKIEIAFPQMDIHLHSMAKEDLS